MSGVMIVESRCTSPEELAAFNDWYDNIHIPEILNLKSFTSAHRLRAIDGDSFIAIYEIEGDVEAAKEALGQALASGAMTRPVGLVLDPPPSTRYFQTLPPGLSKTDDRSG
jgi:hypothetical protein